MTAQKEIIKLENALKDSLNEIDLQYTRKIQGDMHRCAAKCCDNSRDSIEKVYNCVQLCSTDFEKVQHFLQAEYNQFQGRLESCILQCRDDAADSLSSNPSASEIAKYKQNYEACIISCANKHIDMLPQFLKRVKEVLKKKSYL